MGKTKTVFLDEEGNDYPATYESQGEHHLMEERVVAELLLDEVLFMNSRKYVCIDGSHRPETLVLFVICNDIFAWACADAEQVTMKELPELYRMHKEHDSWGSAKWCCFKRNMKPQGPVEKMMRADGVWCERMEALPRNGSHDVCCGDKP